MAARPQHVPHPRPALSSDDAGQDRTLASFAEEPDPPRELLPAWRTRAAHRRLRRVLQHPALSREPGQRHTRGRLLRTGLSHFDKEASHQTKNARAPTTNLSKRDSLKPNQG